VDDLGRWRTRCGSPFSVGYEAPSDPENSTSSRYGKSHTILSVQRTAEQLASLLRARIERGLFVPGQRISQREIAALFATSTTPAREAFQILAAQGFLRIDHNRGAMVAGPTPSEVREIYEIRKALEGLAVREAAERLPPGAYRNLEALNAGMGVASTSEDRVRLNRDFHAALYAAARMPRLAELISQLRSAVSYYVDRAYQSADVTEQAAAEHADILAACRRGDGDAAARALARHLETSAIAAVEFAERLAAPDAMESA
jgi:DNA-binding GntR family transcriptional regulator